MSTETSQTIILFTLILGSSIFGAVITWLILLKIKNKKRR